MRVNWSEHSQIVKRKNVGSSTSTIIFFGRIHTLLLDCFYIVSKTIINKTIFYIVSPKLFQLLNSDQIWFHKLLKRKIGGCQFKSRRCISML